jgi:hypothetical protein
MAEKQPAPKNKVVAVAKRAEGIREHVAEILACAVRQKDGRPGTRPASRLADFGKFYLRVLRKVSEARRTKMDERRRTFFSTSSESIECNDAYEPL